MKSTIVRSVVDPREAIDADRAICPTAAARFVADAREVMVTDRTACPSSPVRSAADPCEATDAERYFCPFTSISKASAARDARGDLLGDTALRFAGEPARDAIAASS